MKIMNGFILHILSLQIPLPSPSSSVELLDAISLVARDHHLNNF